MSSQLAYLFLTAVGCAIYHIGQKSLSPSSNPMVVLMAVYVIAFLLAGLSAPLFKHVGNASWPSQVFCWPVAVVGVGVLLIELGFMLSYRAGSSLQWTGVAVNALAAVILIPVALVVFRESFSLTRLAGIVLALAGMALMGWK
jgi:drug/metabolite transporter (DMT)-like permease